MKVGDLVRYAQEDMSITASSQRDALLGMVGLVFELHRGFTRPVESIDNISDIVHVRMLDGTEVVDSDHFFEVISESR
jgi:hypothetical protein